jgi:adenylate kinase
MNLFREIWMRLARLCFWKRRDARFFVILGAPGSGKGTISALLSQEVERLEGVTLPLLITGNLVRREIEDKTPIGLKWGPVVKAGGMIPDRVIMQLVKRELNKPEYYNGAILDGIPRTVGQARMIRRMLMWWGNKINRVVLLDATEEDLLVRLAGRRTCSNKSCGKTYHTAFNPPKVEDVCNACGSALIVRDDDKPEVVKERLKVYAKASGKLLRFYELSGLLTRVITSNTRSVEEVTKDVLFTIEQFD